MAADLHVEWMKPIELERSGKHKLTLDSEAVPPLPGVYMFFRRIGKERGQAVYIGKAENLRSRVKGQVKNNDIISALLDGKGSYFLMPGVFRPLRGQTADQALDLIERALIRDCVEEGHPLINIKGVRIQTRHVVSTLAAGGKFINERVAFEPPSTKKPKQTEAKTKPRLRK